MNHLSCFKIIFVFTMVLEMGFQNPGIAQTILNPIDDCYIQSGTNASTNYGSLPDLMIKATDNADLYRKTLLKFDLSGITTVNKAVLRLYVNQTKEMNISAYETNDSWTEESVTWATAPATGNGISSTLISTAGLYYEWDVTSYVQSQSTADGIASFLMDEPGSTAQTLKFNSKEAENNPPQLVITQESISYASIPVLEDAKTYYWGTSKYITNYGSETDLVIRFNTEVKYGADSYLKFDISSLTSPREKGLLKLYADSLSRSTVISIYGIESQDSWSENTIAGNDKPVATERIGLYEISGKGEVTFDITNYLNNAIASNWSKITLVLKDAEGAYVSFNSGEAADNNPELLYVDEIITYTSPSVYSGTFYLDSEAGDDTNSGTSEAEPWKNISKLNDLTFAASSSIKLKRGSSWSRQQLSFKGSGTDGNPILVDAYGTGDKPSLNGEGAISSVVQLFNQEYIEISNLAISNLGSTLGDLRRGIYVLADNFGPLHHLYFTKLDITNVNGTDGEISGAYGNSDDAKRTGGLIYEVRGDDVQTYFDDFLVDQCFFQYCSNSGVSNTSHWAELNLNSDWSDNTVPGTSSSHYVHNFVPSKNILIKRNRFDHIQTQGLIVRAADDPIMEYNLFYYCSVGVGSDNACFNSKTTGAVWRYNEACYTEYTDGKSDGAGIDSDLRTKNTLIEYNYCHHNEYGGVITTGGSTTDSFNDSTIIRYNILANNGHNSVRICNQNSNALVYNNLVYYDDASVLNRLVFTHLSSSTPIGPVNTKISNNIFYTTSNSGIFTADVEWTDSRVEKPIYSNNLYYGIDSQYQYPDDDQKVTADPLFVNGVVPEKEIGGYVLLNDDGIPTGEVDISFLKGFQLESTSPAIDAGSFVIDSKFPDLDFTNQTIPQGSTVDIGPFEYEAEITTGTEIISDVTLDNEINVFPNPTTNTTTITSEEYIYEITLTSMSGLSVFINKSLNEKKLQIDMNKYPRGIYILRIVTETGTVSSTKVVLK